MQRATWTDKIRQPMGLTLLEVMMATTIIAIALLSTMSAFINAERLNSVAREEALAQAAINQIIAKMRNTSFGQLLNAQTDPTYPGFSGGVDPITLDRYLPGVFKVNVGGERMPSGVTTSPTYVQGAVFMAGRWCLPADGVPEMRVIFINDENPIEQELGEVNFNQDGFDLDRNGSIGTAPYDTSTWNSATGTSAPNFNIFNDTGATPLFPRKLAAGTPNPPIHAYLNPVQLSVIPVAVQVRWWSRAGLPREISVLTFITNRSPFINNPPVPDSNFNGNP